jgi:DNA-binding MarR family transcriptional regulator
MNKFSQSEVYKFHEIVFCLDDLANKVLTSKTKLSYVQFLILLAINENPTFLQSEVGKWVNLTKSAVSQQVNKLVKMELLTRKENPKDRREKEVNLTVEGQNQLKQSTIIVSQISEDLFTILPKEKRKLLHDLLDELISKGAPQMYSKLSK